MSLLQQNQQKDLDLPEARIPLANAVIEMCLSEKSNSAYSALDAAIKAIHEGKTGDIPFSFT